MGECIQRFFGESLEGAHDALADAQATARVFRFLTQELGEEVKSRAEDLPSDVRRTSETRRELNRSARRNEPILGDWDALTGLSDSDARTADIRELFSIRNDLMHAGGARRSADHAKAKDLFAAATLFIAKSEDVNYRQSGTPNPR